MHQPTTTITMYACLVMIPRWGSWVVDAAIGRMDSRGDVEEAVLTVAAKDCDTTN